MTGITKIHEFIHRMQKNELNWQIWAPHWKMERWNRNKLQIEFIVVRLFIKNRK